MDKGLKDDMLLQKSSDVWKDLVEQGELGKKGYDSELIEELCNKLGLQKDKSIEKQLDEKQISVEKLITTFFSMLKPFSKMMTDLLVVFEKANVKKTSDNLRIKFDFDCDEGTEALEFNLSDFKDWQRVMEKLIQHYYNWELSSDIFWRIFRIFDYTTSAQVDNDEISEWLDTYSEGIWPVKRIICPLTGVASLDEKIKQIWCVLNILIDECSGYSNVRKESRKFGYCGELIKNDATLEGKLKLFGLVDSDNWAENIVSVVYSTVERIKENDSQEMVKQLEDQLQKIIEEINLEPYTVENERENLIEILNLPIWKHRYELYAAWIFTQIINALDISKASINSEQGVLEFSFSGINLATYNNYNPILQVWTELRTHYATPIGKGRKENIQPDYSLAIEPVEDPNSSILVVECKQYKRASAKNFSAALQDYAKGRPNAEVILVNYGPAKQEILEKVDEEVRGRTIIIGDMRPGQDTVIDLFKEKVKLAINRYYNKKSIFEFLPQTQIELSWGEKPRDLDLYMIIKSDVIESEINYNNSGAKDSFPNAVYLEDIRNGFGPECINIFEWHKGQYLIKVHNFSKEIKLAGCGARIRVIDSEEEKVIICPEEGEGEWWNVALINIIDGTLYEINEIS